MMMVVIYWCGVQRGRRAGRRWDVVLDVRDRRLLLRTRIGPGRVPFVVQVMIVSMRNRRLNDRGRRAHPRRALLVIIRRIIELIRNGVGCELGGLLLQLICGRARLAGRDKVRRRIHFALLRHRQQSLLLALLLILYILVLMMMLVLLWSCRIFTITVADSHTRDDVFTLLTLLLVIR